MTKQSGEKRKTSVAAWIALAVVIGLIAVIIIPVISVGWEAFGTMRPGLPYISEWTEIKFPSSSEKIASYSVGGAGDRSITAVVKIKQQEVALFLLNLHKTTICHEYKKEEISIDSSGDNPTWWDLNSARNVRCLEIKPRHPKSHDTRCTIYIRHDDPQFAFVYIDGFLY